MNVKSLIGYVIVPTGDCKTCPNDKEECRKLTLAGGQQICVRNILTTII